MKRSKRINSPGLFLTELIFALLFFAIASAVCIQIFAKAHSIGIYSQQLSSAAAECSSAAELVSAANSEDELLNLLSAAYPEAEFEENGVFIGFDADFAQCSTENGNFVMSVSPAYGEEGINAEIVFSSGDEEIYSLSVFRHIQRRAE